MQKILVTALLAASNALSSAAGMAGAQTVPSISSTTTYHTVTVDGLKIFYREAGPKDAPTILLLHGYPSSSRMFATLIPLLADRYHLVAPDYPGFGESEPPGDVAHFGPRDAFYPRFVGALLDELGVASAHLVGSSMGGAVVYTEAVTQPARIRSLDSATGLLYIVAALILAGEIAARTLFFLTGVAT